MARTPHTEYRLAFDHPLYQAGVDKAIILLRDAGINRAIWYVLVGYNTTPKQDLERLNYLRDAGQRAFVQRFSSHYSEPFYVANSEWANQRHLFATKTWDEFLSLRADRRRHKVSFDKLLGRE